MFGLIIFIIVLALLVTVFNSRTFWAVAFAFAGIMTLVYFSAHDQSIIGVILGGFLGFCSFGLFSEQQQTHKE